jgi:hypothetical protein
MPVEQLTFEFGDGNAPVSLDGLKELVSQTLEILHSIEQRFTVSGMTVKWKVVRLSMHSPVKISVAPDVRIEPSVLPRSRSSPTAIGNRMTKAVFKGVEALEKTKPGRRLPRDLPPDAAKAIQKLIKVAEKEGATVSIGESKNKITLTEAVSKNVDALLIKNPDYADFSTIEGTLEVVNAHDRTYFVVWETLTNNRIECMVDEDRLQEALKNFNKRVSVTGRVKYKNDVPITVYDVEAFEVLPGPDQVLRLEDMKPIDISGSESPEDYVRRMRDG